MNVKACRVPGCQNHATDDSSASLYGLCYHHRSPAPDPRDSEIERLLHALKNLRERADTQIAELTRDVDRLTRQRDEAIKRANDAFTAFEVARSKP